MNFSVVLQKSLIIWDVSLSLENEIIKDYFLLPGYHVVQDLNALSRIHNMLPVGCTQHGLLEKSAYIEVKVWCSMLSFWIT